MNLDDKELVKIEAMISSMTVEERAHPELFVVDVVGDDHVDRRAAARSAASAPTTTTSRVKRVAKGSGRKETEVKELLQQVRA